MLRELGGLGLGRAGHAGELVVHAEVVLQGDRGEGLVLLLDLHALLGLDRLVQALGPAPALEDAAGELVDDLHLAVLDDVVLVALVQLLGLERGLELVDEVRLTPRRTGSRRRAPARPPRCPPRWGRRCASPRRRRSRTSRLRPADDAGELVVELGRVGDPAADDERRAGLVDEDRVDLVDDGSSRGPAAPCRSRRHGHVVAEVVEAELVVRAVGDVAARTARACGPESQSPGMIRPTLRPSQRWIRPIHSASRRGQVVVDRDEVDALAGRGR